MHSAMLRTELIEDLNRLACAQEQDRFASDPQRAREALERLRFIEGTELASCRRRQWLAPHEADLIERLLDAARSLTPLPAGADPVRFTRADANWQSVRERARELLDALGAVIDLGVPGWEPRDASLARAGRRPAEA